MTFLPLIAHIETHVDGDLSLDALADMAGMSKFHLHRTFAASVGETPGAFVARARLERAALQLMVRKASVLDIALDCGFRSHEVFVRAFRRRYRMTPTRWRTQESATPRSADTSLANDLAQGSVSATKLHEQRELTVAFIRHVGPYEQVQLSFWSEIAAWAKRRALVVSGFLGVAHDAPGLVAPDRLRFDACAIVPDGTPSPSRGRIAVRTLPAATYGVTTYVGPLTGLAGAYRAGMARLQTRTGVDVIGLPAVERYRTVEVLDGRIEIVDICLPVGELPGHVSAHY